MNGRRIAATALAATIGLIVALLLAGSSQGLALLVYVLFLATLALILVLGRVRAALPEAPGYERLVARAPMPDEPVAQFETISRTLSSAGWMQADLHYRLRPLVREIVGARLSRRYGIDLDHDPERARTVVGGGLLWELVRPGREPPEDRLARGWQRGELEELLEELEAI